MNTYLVYFEQPRIACAKIELLAVDVGLALYIFINKHIYAYIYIYM